MHQGRVIAAEFIGFTESQARVDDSTEVVTAHQELMSNFFAQPDALALGKTIEQLQKEGVPENLLQHKFFPGDRPSLSILF
jgi:glucose-6-phosphate isomerase